MDQLQDLMHLAGPLSGLCWICSCFLTIWISDSVYLLQSLFVCLFVFRSATSSSVLHLFCFLKFFEEQTAHHTDTFQPFGNWSLRILLRFNKNNKQNMCFYVRLLGTKFGNIQFIPGSLESLH